MNSLNKNQVEYVLFHLNAHIHLSTKLNELICYIQEKDLVLHHSKIIFLASNESLNLDNVPLLKDIPILFPVLNSKEFFFEDEKGNLIFCHDFLKSIFYLLSGYQEYSNPNSSDNLKRFSFKDSLQNKLGFIHKPIVNYYFDFIIDGIEVYCKKRGNPLTRKKLFSKYGFLLSHDIDKIDTYDLNYVVYKGKELLGFRKSKLGFIKNLKLFIKGVFEYFNFIKRDNPYWNFGFIREVERKRNFRSTFYFLDKGVKHSDAYYDFGEKRLIKLYNELQRENCEIGLHGSVKSIESALVMETSLNKLKRASGAAITGIRQHRLLWKHPITAKVQEKCGLKYDTTLGFAAHEGFRNSYCWPFKLYDFENNRAINIWEFPLNAMDVTLFAYQNYPVGKAMNKCTELIDEVKKFGGIFSLLFHNSVFDETTYPGITKFYLDLLDEIQTEGENILGSELATKMDMLSLELSES